MSPVSVSRRSLMFILAAIECGGKEYTNAQGIFFTLLIVVMQWSLSVLVCSERVPWLELVD